MAAAILDDDMCALRTLFEGAKQTYETFGSWGEDAPGNLWFR